MSRIGFTPRKSLVLVCLLLAPYSLHAGAEAENDRWVPGYSSPGFAGTYNNIVSEWDLNGFVMALVAADCLDVPGPNGTFVEAQIWIWNGEYYYYTGDGCAAGSINAVEQRGPNVYIGGGFTSIDGQSIQYLARWDGQAWSAPWLASGQLNGPVLALDNDGTQNMYVGGSFSFAGALGVHNVAKLDGFVWEPLDDAGGVDEGTNGPVTNIDVGGTGIVVVGPFSTAGGENDVGNIASWSAGLPFGSWSSFGDGVAAATGLSSVSVGSGEVWVTGAFTEPLIPATNIALWDFGGGFWASPGDPTAMGSILEVDITGGNRVIARGDFTDFGDPNTQRVAEWVPTMGTWDAIPNIEDAYDPTLFNLGKRVLAMQNGFYYFDQRDDATEADLPVYHGGITWFDGLNWHGLGQGFGDFDLGGQGHYVTAVYKHNEEIFVGGRFPNGGDALHEGLARWQGGDWVAAGETLTSIGQVVVRDFATYKGDLVMGGCFVASGGTTLNSVARWNGSAWTVLGGGMPPSFCLTGIPDDVLYEGVHKLLPMGSDLYVGGDFGGSVGDNLSMWNGASWAEVGGGTNGPVNDLVESGGNLYASGTFTRVNNNIQTVGRIAMWNGLSWDDLDGGMDNGTAQYEGVFALAKMGSDLYAAGDFTTAGGVAVNNIARWDGADWNAVGAGLNGLVLDLEVVGTDLYVSGEFTEAGGQVARGIAKWDGSTWTPLGYGLSYVSIFGSGVGTGFELFYDPATLQPGASPEGDPSGSLYVGGQFSFTGDKLSNNFGIYQLGNVDTVFGDGFESGDTSAWSASVP